MGMRAYRQALERMKESEQPEAVVLVAADKDCVNIVAAWPNCGVGPKRRITGNDPQSEPDAWDWLWRNSSFSSDALSAASGVSPKALDSKLRVLIANRAIYPDGSVNSFVKRYLRERVLKLLGVDAQTRRAFRRGSRGIAGTARE